MFFFEKRRILKFLLIFKIKRILLYLFCTLFPQDINNYQDHKQEA